MTTGTDNRGIAGTQFNAAGALMSLLTAHATLPTPAIRLEELKVPGTHDFAWGLNIALHHGLDHFEQWRQALGIDPATINHDTTKSSTTKSGTLGWLEATTTYASVPLRLTGYHDSRATIGE
ncbi:hypothetical protein ACIQOW_07530 [Kitasatospora sp. NPDC091335]|uniref:hypothetical protein n=1 Tax=Kitasatospora sp. NPDC091335 TaxID=3364085 RepID=UPI003806937C